MKRILITTFSIFKARFGTRNTYWNGLKPAIQVFFLLILLLFGWACKDKKAATSAPTTSTPIHNISPENLHSAIALFDSTYQKGLSYSASIEKQNEAYNKVIQLIENIALTDSSTESGIAICKLGYAYYRIGKLDKAEFVLQAGLGILAAKPTISCQYVWWLGLIQIDKRDFSAAMNNFQVSKNCISEETLPHYYSIISNCYLELGEYDKCIASALQALNYAKQDFMQSHCYLTLAVATQNQENYAQALDYFQKGYDLCKNKGKMPILYRFNFGKLYKDLANQSEDASQKAEYFQLARKYYREELAELPQTDDISCGLILNNVGFSYKDEGKLDSAILIFQQALTQLLPDYKEKDIYKVPNMQNPYSYDDIIRTCSGMGKTLRLKYEESKQIADLQASVRYFSQVPILMQQMRQTLGTEESKSLLTSLLYNVYEPALEATYLCYQSSPNAENLQIAYNFIQAGKSLALLEEIQDKQALKAGGIPDELLRKDSILLAEILQIQKQIDKKGDIQLYQKKADLMQAQSLLRKTFETDYPTYFALKYPNNQVEIKDLEKKCEKDNMAMIDYFQGRKQIFSVYITPKKQGITRTLIQEDSLIAQIDSFLVGMKRGDVQLYAQPAYQLYQTCFASVDSVLSATNCQAAILIPDGFLHKIPFEALLTKDYKGKSFNEVEFLLKKRILSYTHSAYLWLNPVQNNAGSGLLALAPGFNDNFYSHVVYPEAKKFAGLPTTLKTLKGLKEKYAMDLFTEEKAQKSVFLQSAARYKVLHFGTHAVANDEIPSQSYLVLAPEKDKDSLQNGFLYTNDIYATRLNAKLALLTACQTGKGKIKKGEGVMSLSRAFRFAGCSSIMMTLWQVNEAPTAELTTYLYEGMHQGKSLNIALHEAKLKYLSEAKPYQKNPYNWSALVLIGDTYRLENESFPIKWILIGLAGLLLCVGFFFFVKRRR